MQDTNEHADEKILNLLVTDGERAMQLMFQHYYGFLCQVIARILSDEHAAEDLVQEIFFDVWKKRAELQIKISLRAYLRRAAVNKTLNYIRDRKIRWDDEEKLVLMPSDVPGISQTLDSEELQQRIEAAIDSLPERCRLVFSLSRFEEMTYQEIANHLNISVKTVENQMTKALRVLKEAIKT